MSTAVIESIGTAGRDYSTPAAWESATDNDLIAADERRIGELYNDSSFTGLCNIIGATTDSGHYRWLRHGGSGRYVLRTDTGVRFVHASSRANGVVQLNESYVRCKAFLIHSTYTGSSTHRNIRIRKNNAYCEGVASYIPAGTGAKHCFYMHNLGGWTVASCIAIGSGGSIGANRGFLEQSPKGWEIIHCLAYGITQGAGRGFEIAGVADVTVPGSFFHNNAAFDCDDPYHFSLSLSITASHNAGEEAAGAIPGSSSVANVNLADEYLEDAAALPSDFRLHHDADQVDAGTSFTSSRPWNGESFQGGVDHGDASGSINVGPFDGRWVDFIATLDIETDGVADMGLVREMELTIPIVVSGVGVLTLRVQPKPGPDALRFDREHFLSLLWRLWPPGKLWSRLLFGRAGEVLEAGADEAFRVSERSGDVLREADPHFTDELLLGWERDYGLPEPCEVDPFALTAEQRRAALLRKIRDRRGQTVEDLIAAAATLGFQVTIQEYRPMRAAPEDPTRQDLGSVAGDRLSQAPQGWPNTFTVFAPEETIRDFKAGQGRCTEPLRVWNNEVLECALNRIKPAHTIVTFVYGESEEWLQQSSTPPAPPPGPGPQPARGFVWPA